MKSRKQSAHRLDRTSDPSLRNWAKPKGPAAEQMRSNAVVDMGWGRLVFAHTFESQEKLVELMCDEKRGDRDIAFYLRDPHVILSMAPHRLFLDPSHTYRLWLHHYRHAHPPPRAFTIRRIKALADAKAVNRIYAARDMVTCDPRKLLDRNATRLHTDLVAEAIEDDRVVGAVTGIDHAEAFNDPENGSSLWSLAVDPQCHIPGVGQWLVRHLAEHYQARGRAFVDRAVMHDNEEAIALYEKLGFKRVPVFCIKNKNPINEPLFVAPEPEAELNPYAQIIVHEARRRGVIVDMLDEKGGFFELHFGGRSIICRESLTELTTAIAMSRCDDKAVTARLLRQAKLSLPDQREADGSDEDQAFLARHERIVVKPARGEQGAGVSVDVSSVEEMRAAIDAAKLHCRQVLLEQMVDGEDLRVIVIDFKAVAAAVRRPPKITGTGRHTVEQLIERYNRRRMAATGGESAVPLDEETARCVRAGGYAMDQTLPANEQLQVRRAANLHTGGTIHDVTEHLNPALVDASVRAARAIDIPVVGLDFIVPDYEGEQYVIIEANERPGLANHEPAPTAERFIDLLFPNSIPQGQPAHTVEPQAPSP